MRIVIGTRGSDLALTQTRTVAAMLRAVAGVTAVDIQVIKTAGDRIQNTPLSAVTGSPDERKGFFTKELEDALLDKTVDVAVHSYKDLPTADVPGLTIGAVPERVGARDVLILGPGARARAEAPFIAPGTAIGTASVRRMALVEQLWPDVRTVALRGNLPTRLLRLREGLVPNLEEPDAPPVPIRAILLAEAGVERLRAAGLFDSGEYAGLLNDLTFIPLEPEIFPPAPAQGALAIQCRSDDTATLAVLAKLHDARTELSLRVERRVLAALEGGCHLPLGISCRSVSPALPSGPGSNGELRVDLFLGAQAEDNRAGRSVRHVRYGQDSADGAVRLAEQLVVEIKEQLPVVFTGRAERSAELAREYPLVELPLLGTEELDPAPDDLARLRSWLETASGQPGGSARAVLAFFSVPGVRAFSALLKRHNLALPPQLPIAVTGERTALCVSDCFPSAEVLYRSSDGTGLALAGVLIESGVRRVLAIAAERGRPEFQEQLERHGGELLRLALYRTRRITPDTEQLAGLPSRSYVVLGSPSSVDGFFDGLADASSIDPGGFAFCAIGPTTAVRIRERGAVPYAVAAEADYSALLSELIQTRPTKE